MSDDIGTPGPLLVDRFPMSSLPSGEMAVGMCAGVAAERSVVDRLLPSAGVTRRSKDCPNRPPIGLSPNAETKPFPSGVQTTFVLYPSNVRRLRVPRAMS